MTMNPLPPQAYTKDTLLKAYAWLQNQSGNIKELASTPDILVSLYLKAQRDGDQALQTPSIQNFKNELRSLAGIMGEFERYPEKPVSVAAAPTPAAAIPAGPAVMVQEPKARPAPVEAPIPKVEAPVIQPSIFQNSGDLISALDSESQELIHEVKKALNLSCETEALRAAIKLGGLRIRELIQK